MNSEDQTRLVIKTRKRFPQARIAIEVIFSIEFQFHVAISTVNKISPKFLELLLIIICRFTWGQLSSLSSWYPNVSAVLAAGLHQINVYPDSLERNPNWNLQCKTVSFKCLGINHLVLIFSAVQLLPTLFQLRTRKHFPAKVLFSLLLLPNSGSKTIFL